ncbi:GntR family transcriptional regulator [Nonomuraea wenchangensis]
MIVTIDPRSFEPVYLQLARILRDAIQAGEFGPGEKLPSETRLCQQYELGRDAVRDALQVLRSEGAIVTVKGAGSFVRGQSAMDVVRLPEDARVTSRMPTADERRSLGVGEGVPVFVVTAGETVKVYPADRTVLVTSGG